MEQRIVEIMSAVSITHEQKKNGVKKELVAQLPTSLFKPNPNLLADEAKCSICMCEYEEGEELKTLMCLHRFHTACIEEWLEKSEVCPLCKYKVEE